MKNIKLTPKQMAAVANKINETYSKMISENKIVGPYYDHLVIDNEMIKLGFIPGEPNSKTVMEIRIVYKGGVNGK